jgi:hypothetical protein
VVRDTQSKINIKIEEVKALTDHIKKLRNQLESLGTNSQSITHDLFQELPHRILDKEVEYEYIDNELGKC